MSTPVTAEIPGLADALDEFCAEGTVWHNLVIDGPEREVDRLALALGVSIGVIVGRDSVVHEREGHA